ncbi:MAG: membrane protein insertion efficiency factor YidD [Gammaproteobacteria bacterium RIFCSPLOWO2_02_FULL_61_13]|nr:MAG: membrane protein insertion efficiency factor YidD [Gammaproteobacteria bacterium RIFCSPLOWO2_02_FULL_61_13]
MRALLTGLIRVYRLAFSPYFGGQCRFHPTCSEYMLEALRVHGTWAGIRYGLGRILRCHPFCAGGVDPVPSE